MPTRPQAYHRPETLGEALRLLQHPLAAPLAGGTRLLADDVAYPIMVDLQDLGLTQLDLMNDQLRIGAMVRLYQLHESGEISGGASEIFKQAVYQAGPNTFRHAATLGGVIGSREASSELLAVLLALDTELMVAYGQAGRATSLAEYLRPDDQAPDLITEIVIPWTEGRGALTRVARTPADQPIVSVAAWQPKNGDIQLAATGISPRPVRLPNHTGNLAQTLQRGQEFVTHAGDFLGSVAYRREMLTVLTCRAIQQINA